MSTTTMSKKKVSYYYDDICRHVSYGDGHPMKPLRVAMTHELLIGYKLTNYLDIFQPTPLSFADLCKFHSNKYINFLSTVNPSHAQLFEKGLRLRSIQNKLSEEPDEPLDEETAEFLREITEPEHGMIDQVVATFEKFGMDGDCPAFPRLYEFCQIYGGGSVGGAYRLNHEKADIAINWSGGLHHAKKCGASGFCYVNDIVLAILELLKYHQRVLYIDIDVHHGDGVEEAFWTTDRVLTISFHKYGNGFFPRTGNIDERGHGKGLNYALNFPMKDGIDDENYKEVFKNVMSNVMQYYDPGAIVLQCGADSLAHDKLGSFNLTLDGHSFCVEYMKSFNKPLLLLGGGGYTIRNVSRAWTFETAIALGKQKDLSNNLPVTTFYDRFGPSHELHFRPNEDLDNDNSLSFLQHNTALLLSYLKEAIDPVPSVQYSTALGSSGHWREEAEKKQKEEQEEKFDRGAATNHSSSSSSSSSSVLPPSRNVVFGSGFGSSGRRPENEFYQDDADQDVTLADEHTHAHTHTDTPHPLVINTQAVKEQVQEVEQTSKMDFN